MDNQIASLNQSQNDKFLNRIRVKSSIFSRINRDNIRNTKKKIKLFSYKSNVATANCVELNSVISVQTSFGVKHYLTIVLPEDADITANKLSVFSSLGSAVYGQKEGDTVKWKFLEEIEYAKILKVSSPNYKSSNFLTTK